MSNGETTQEQTDYDSTLNLTESEQAILDRVGTYLNAGLDMKRWWEEKYPDGFEEKFEIGATFNRPASSFGFYDEAYVDGRDMPIMGNFQSMAFDQPKIMPNGDADVAAKWMQDQIRQFVMHYFMRVSDFRQPQAKPAEDHPKLPVLLQPFSTCPPSDGQQIGFGFEQLFYHRDGKIGRFPESQRGEIVDLRSISDAGYKGEQYDWVVLKVNIFHFSFAYMPFGLGAPHLVAPLAESSYLVMTPDFVKNTDSDPDDDVLGRYGLGYAFIKDPGQHVLAYGPGQFDAAIEQIDFVVYTDGRVRVDMAFVVNRPERILNLPLNPIHVGLRLADAMSFGMASRAFAPVQKIMDRPPFNTSNVDPVFTLFTLANAFTAGQAAKRLCMSREALDRQSLEKHFMQHYETIAGALQTWRQVADWTVDETELPQWVIRGESS